MSHYLTIGDGRMNDEPTLTLVCTAVKGADCRKRPAIDREEWSLDDPDLIDGECWAVEWISEAGWEDSVHSAEGAVWPRIPVTVEYDEGVVIAPIVPQDALPIGDES